MVTYFNKKDLVKFGEYLLSDERTELVLSHPEGRTEEDLKKVSHADVKNFLEKCKT